MTKNNTEIQTFPTPNLPALHHAATGLSNLVTIKFTDNLPAEQKTTVIGYAVEVHHHAMGIKTSAMGICLALFRCREAYGEGESRASSSKNGWNAFCEANFAHLGLSDGNIRAAVRSGEILAKMQTAEPDGVAIFSRLSRAALFALGDTPEMMSEVKEILENNPKEAPTAKEIKDLKDSLRKQTESTLNSEAELAKAIEKIRQVNQNNADVNNMLVERENEVVTLKKQNFDLDKKAKTPVESLIPSLPKGVKNEAEMLDKLNADIKDKQNQQRLAAQEFDATTNKLSNVKRSLAQHEQTADALKQFETDISALLTKFPDVLLQTMTATSTAVKETIGRIAVKLHTLASHLETT